MWKARSVARTLVITNDYPPRPGGIQSYIESYLRYLDPEDVCVLASTFRGAESTRYDARHPYRVERVDTEMLLPTPELVRRARRLCDDWQAETIWFGAAAPLAMMAGALRRGTVRHIVASTHGHEVGWSMVPGARDSLRYIGGACDAVTYVSHYTRTRLSAALGRHARLIHAPGGVDVHRFRPQPDPAARAATRAEIGAPVDGPLIVCVSRLVPRKGQDMLIDALPAIREAVPHAHLVLAGGGPYRARLEKLAVRNAVRDAVTFTGRIDDELVVRLHQAADVFAMPARTRGGGLDVEGLGIVYLEASACGVPVVAGRSGGAPETVRDGMTGTIVDGNRPRAIAAAIIRILTHPDIAAAMGQAGREWAAQHWSWEELGSKMREVLLPWED